MNAKYHPLQDDLEALPPSQSSATLSFQEIERIIAVVPGIVSFSR
jgi:hypothetical protein